MSKGTAIVRRIAFVALGLVLTALFALPYLCFRSQLRQYSVLGYIGLAVSCAISNLSVLVPSSATVYVLLGATVLNPLACILVGGMGTALGEQASYLCGLMYGKGGRSGARRPAPSGRVARWMGKNAFLTVFLFALAPLPVFDIAGIGAGIEHMKWHRYLLAAFLGKTLKFAVFTVCFFVVFPALYEMLPDGVPMLRKLLEYAAQLIQADGAASMQ